MALGHEIGNLGLLKIYEPTNMWIMYRLEELRNGSENFILTTFTTTEISMFIIHGIPSIVIQRNFGDGNSVFIVLNWYWREKPPSGECCKRSASVTCLLFGTIQLFLQSSCHYLLNYSWTWILFAVEIWILPTGYFKMTNKYTSRRKAEMIFTYGLCKGNTWPAAPWELS